MNLFLKPGLVLRGGGDLFCIKRDFKLKIIEDFSIFNECIFKSLCIEVEFSNNNSALLISLYRFPSHNILPPSEHNQVFLEYLECLLSNLSGSSQAVYILYIYIYNIILISSRLIQTNWILNILINFFWNTTYKATHFSKETNLSLIKSYPSSYSKYFWSLLSFQPFFPSFSIWVFHPEKFFFIIITKLLILWQHVYLFLQDVNLSLS